LDELGNDKKLEKAVEGYKKMNNPFIFTPSSKGIIVR